MYDPVFEWMDEQRKLLQNVDAADKEMVDGLISAGFPRQAAGWFVAGVRYGIDYCFAEMNKHVKSR